MFKNIYFLFGASLFLVACTTDNVTPGKGEATSVSVVDSAIQKPQANYSLENSAVLDHKVRVFGMRCKRVDFDLAFSKKMRERLKKIDKDNSLNSPPLPDVKIIYSSSSSTLKCVDKFAVSGRCLAEVNVTGKIVPAEGESKPFEISKTFTQKVLSCEGASETLHAARDNTISEIMKTLETQNN